MISKYQYYNSIYFRANLYFDNLGISQNVYEKFQHESFLLYCKYYNKFKVKGEHVIFAKLVSNPGINIYIHAFLNK